jgi:hypothetical protein
MTDLPIGKALVALQIRKGCGDCDFQELNGWCGLFECNKKRREDGKNVIFKLIDYPKNDTDIEENRRLAALCIRAVKLGVLDTNFNKQVITSLDLYERTLDIIEKNKKEGIELYDA